MSTTYTDLTETAFPDGSDNLSRMRDVAISDLTLLEQYETYIAAGNFTEAAALIAANESLAQIIMNAEKYNKLSDAVVAIERTFHANGWRGNSGSAMIMRGEYDKTVTYSEYDCVSYRASLYKCLAADPGISGIAPDEDSTKWQKWFFNGSYVDSTSPSLMLDGEIWDEII